MGMSQRERLWTGSTAAYRGDTSHLRRSSGPGSHPPPSYEGLNQSWQPGEAWQGSRRHCRGSRVLIAPIHYWVRGKIGSANWCMRRTGWLVGLGGVRSGMLKHQGIAWRGKIDSFNGLVKRQTELCGIQLGCNLWSGGRFGVPSRVNVWSREVKLEVGFPASSDRQLPTHLRFVLHNRLLAW